MAVVRHVTHVSCEYCKPETQRFCIICGGHGYVELAVWREEPDDGTQDVARDERAEEPEDRPQPE